MKLTILIFGSRDKAHQMVPLCIFAGLVHEDSWSRFLQSMEGSDGSVVYRVGVLYQGDYHVQSSRIHLQ